jgi:photosystem II stability/assembly factor-like uncharacterized protein
MRRLAVLVAALSCLPVLAQEKPPKPSEPRKQPAAQTPVVTSLTIFAGGPGGLWLSSDWGATWKKAEKKGDSAVSPETMGAVRAILPVGPTVYVAGSGGGFVSDDFGETWNRWPIEDPVLSIMPSRYPLADLTLYVGTSKGLLVSEDAGRTFKPTRLQGVAVHRMEWPGPALVVGTSAGVVITKDMGVTWAPPGEGLPSGPVESLALSSFFAADPVLFAGIGQEGVFRSEDGGRTWGGSGLQESRVVDLVWLGPFLYALTEKGLFRSQDAGASWAPIGKGLEGAPQRILFPLAPANGAEVFLATDRGIWRSGDGAESFLPIGHIDETVSVLATFPQVPLPTGKKK